MAVPPPSSGPAHPCPLSGLVWAGEVPRGAAGDRPASIPTQSGVAEHQPGVGLGSPL